MSSEGRTWRLLSDIFLHALDVYFTKYDYRSDALRLLEDFMTNDDNC